MGLRDTRPNWAYSSAVVVVLVVFSTGWSPGTDQEFGSSIDTPLIGPPRSDVRSHRAGALDLDGFVENLGQFNDDQVHLYAYGPTGGISLLESEVRLTVTNGESSTSVSMTFPGSHRVEPSTMNELPGRTNYIVGRDRTTWVQGVSTFSGVTYGDLWDGIDLVLSRDLDGFKYSFNVDQGADVRQVSVRVSGHLSLELLGEGDLVIRTVSGDIFDSGLNAHYSDDTSSVVPSSFMLIDESTYGYDIGEYDTGRGLVIDPLVYSTYFGTEANEDLDCITIDEEGYVFLAGTASKEVLRSRLGVLDPPEEDYLAFISKFDPRDWSPIFTTVIGGSNHTTIQDMHVDALGEIYITGETRSFDFPVTDNAYQMNHSKGSTAPEAFACKLSSDGTTLVYSTLFGGRDSDDGTAITTDNSGTMYIVGTTWSSDFPVTNDGYQSTFGGKWMDAFIAKVHPGDGAVDFVTYLGGASDDNGKDIWINTLGEIVIAGYTWSRNFPTTSGAPYERYLGGQSDCFIAMLSPDGSRLVRSTLLGGSDRDRIDSMGVDDDGNIYVSGLCDSPDLPTTDGAFMTARGKNVSSFAAKLRHDWSSFDYITFIGGGFWDYVEDMVVDGEGNAYFVGGTLAEDMQVSGDAVQADLNGRSDGFLQVLDTHGRVARYSTYLGGNQSDSIRSLETDEAGDVYIIGITWSEDFPTTDDAAQRDYGGGQVDYFFSHITVELEDPTYQTYSSELWMLVIFFIIVTILLVLAVVKLLSMSEEPSDDEQG